VQPVYDNKRRLILLGNTEIPEENPWFPHILRDIRHGGKVPDAVVMAAGAQLVVRLILPVRELFIHPRAGGRGVCVSEADTLAYSILNAYSVTRPEPDQTLLVAIFYHISKQHQCATSSQQ